MNLIHSSMLIVYDADAMEPDKYDYFYKYFMMFNLEHAVVKVAIGQNGKIEDSWGMTM